MYIFAISKLIFSSMQIFTISNPDGGLDNVSSLKKHQLENIERSRIMHPSQSCVCKNLKICYEIHNKVLQVYQQCLDLLAV